MPEGDKANNYKPTKKADDVHNIQPTGTQAQKIQMSKARRPAILQSGFPRTVIVDNWRVERGHDHAIHDLMCVAYTLSDQTRV